MHLTVQKFILLITFVLLIMLLSVFSYFYLTQQEKTASVILKSLSSTLSETSYVLSRNIKNEETVLSTRPLIDRVSANNDFIEAIVIHNGNSILVSSDPHHNKILPTSSLHNIETIKHGDISEISAIEESIHYYEGSKAKELKLMIILDRYEIDLYLNENKISYLIYFGLLPLIALVSVWCMIRVFVVKPLEVLRQFAYYQNSIPKSLSLRELEVIRYSMVQTFQTLDNEKKELYLMARTDSLSGLANRNALNEFLERLIASSSRDSKEFAFMFLDLDHFKTVNDSLGHNVGDELLKNIASIIDEVLRSTDFVARVGGDEFVIIIQDYDSLMELTNIIDRIQKHLAKTWIIQTHPVSIDSSIGVSFFPKDGDDIVSLMKSSDIAMYEAKEKGRGRYHFFTEELNDKVQHTIALDKDMRQALKNSEYELYYQPKVNVQSGEVVGIEALIRWISPVKGMIAPDVFIPLAEENGFIVELGEWVINEAIEQQKSFKEQGLDLIVSINVSSKQLLKDNFETNFKSILDKNEVSPSKIDIEITEYMFLEQSECNCKVLDNLHEYGVSISLDDFGTGYSSLSYLKEFPVDNLKIDKSFIDDFSTEKGSIFVETIVKMGQTLNMKIIAEGVELKGQVEYLKSIGCDQYQGYYFSKPLSVKDFEESYIK